MSKYPELEKDIVSVITQAKNKENIDLGAKVLQKYNYDSSTNLSQEPIVQNNIYKMLKINIIGILIYFLIKKYNKVNIGGKMLDILKKIDIKKTGIFAAGVLFGTAWIKLLTSRDANKVYSHGTAAVLRAKDCVMKTVTNVQENASDIYAEAKQINADREIEAEAQVVEDEAETEEQAEENEICD